MDLLGLHRKLDAILERLERVEWQTLTIETMMRKLYRDEYGADAVVLQREPPWTKRNGDAP